MSDFAHRYDGYSGYPDIPRAMNTVFPDVWLARTACIFGDRQHTGLHTREASPCVEGQTVDEATDESAYDEYDIHVSRVQLHEKVLNYTG